MELNSVRIHGKVMLSGEYAVLYGAPAVLVPVPRYLTLSESPEPIETTSPVLKHALAEPIEEIASWEEKYPLRHVTVDRSEFYLENSDGSSIKLGLGSSAAEAVGIVALRFERAGIPWVEHRERVALLAENAHRKAQGGIGSGADVVTIAHDCPIRFRRTPDGFEATPVSDEEAKALPPLALYHSGIAADTRQLVAKFQTYAESSKDAAKQLEHLIELSGQIADGWFMGDSSALYQLLDRFNHTMTAFTMAAGFTWKTTAHLELETWAEERGGRAKPTGAGGGDLILTVGDLPLDERNEPRIRW